MQRYLYRAVIEPGDEAEWVVSFPDVPEAITQAATIPEARKAAQDALGLALLSYPMRGLAVPPRHFHDGPHDGTRHEADIAVAPDIAAKLAVLDAFAASGLTKTQLAIRIGKDEKEVRRILDPMHATKFGTLCTALEALGRRMVIGVLDRDEAA